MRNKPWLMLLISLLASVVLWAYVVTAVSPEATETIENIPVTFSGEEYLRDRDLTITAGADATVTLRVTGKRSIVTTLDSTNITITVDVSKIQAADTFTRSYSITYPNSIQASSLTVESRTPSGISFTVEELVHKEIPVKAVWNGTLAEDYMLESCQPTVNSITVTGTASRVESLSKAIVILEDENLSTGYTKNMSYSIVDEDGNEADLTGLTVDTDVVGVTTKVLFTKQLPLAIAIEAGGGATEANVMWEIDPLYITVSGEESTLNDLNKLVLETVSLAGITGDTTMTRSIILPDGVRNESGEISADISLTLVGLNKKTIRVSDITFANVPSGYVAEAVTSAVSVTVRGPAASVDALAAGNIRLVADLTGNTGSTGNFTCSDVRVYVDNATNDCGVLGSYTVFYKLMTEEEYLETLEEAEKTEAAGKVG